MTLTVEYLYSNNLHISSQYCYTCKHMFEIGSIIVYDQYNTNIIKHLYCITSNDLSNDTMRIIKHSIYKPYLINTVIYGLNTLSQYDQQNVKQLFIALSVTHNNNNNNSVLHQHNKMLNNNTAYYKQLNNKNTSIIQCKSPARTNITSPYKSSISALHNFDCDINVSTNYRKRKSHFNDDIYSINEYNKRQR